MYGRASLCSPMGLPPNSYCCPVCMCNLVEGEEEVTEITKIRVISFSITSPRRTLTRLKCTIAWHIHSHSAVTMVVTI